MHKIKPLLNNPLKVLMDKDIEEIHSSSLQVLEKVGINFHNDDALQILSTAGCAVENTNVKFPQTIVNKAIDNTPSSVVFKARDPKKNVHLGSGVVHTTGAFGATFVREPGSNIIRKARMKDLEEFTLVFDNLEYIDYCLKSVIPQDVPQNYVDIYATSALFSNTDKNIHISQDCPTNTGFITQKIIELGKVAAKDSNKDDTPFFSLGCCPDSPLQYNNGSLVRMKIAIEADIPFLIVSGAIAGISTPVTLAGMLVVQHAELLAGLVYAQLLRPGCEVVFGSFGSSADMKTGKMHMGAVEQSLIGIATQQLCNYCHICYGYGTAGLTDSELLDVQAGYDKGIGLALQMLSGVDVLHDAAGLLNSAMVMNLEEIIIDHEYLRMIAHGMRGIEVCPETIAIELIQEIGPGGSFLTAEHTLNNFRQEFFLSDIFIQKDPSEGRVDETRGMREAAYKKAKEILSSHKPSPLPDNAEKEMTKILEDLP